MSERELVLYEKIVRELEVDVPRPDVLVYLQANTETLLGRIRQRGRPFEKQMDREYLKALNEAYNYFFFHYTDAPLLVVNTDPIDFVRNTDELEDLSQRILSHHEGTVYYTPMPRAEPRRELKPRKPRARRRQETTA